MENNKNCAFCNIENRIDKNRIIYQDDIWIAIEDGYPVSKGHTLLIPKRHVETYFGLDSKELSTLHSTIGVIKKILDTKYNPDGYNIGINCGEASGQTIMHCHIHIIPRYNGDVENPRGGVRGVIPSKQSY